MSRSRKRLYLSLMLSAIRRQGERQQTAERGVGERASRPPTPAEARVLRALGLVFGAVLLAFTLTSHPQPSLHGRGLGVLVGLLLVVGGVVGARPRGQGPPGCEPTTNPTGVVVALCCVACGAMALALFAPNGSWLAGPYFIAIVAASKLDRRGGAAMLAVAIVPFTALALARGEVGTALNSSLAVAPWYLVMRLMRMLGERNRMLDASRAAEAQAAVAAERGRLAREMHDVLAHSLSALALQLESTRLLARDRGVDSDVVAALDRAHGIAASGLDDARRAIAAARGDELPGPERLQALAGAFSEQSGVPVAVEVRGEPRELPSDARLAIYRTAQEALTNVRRHAAAERVQVSLRYLPEGTVLVVEDRACAGTPPAVVGQGGYGLQGMRERAKLLGGELDAGATASGFRVELRLPA